MDKITIGLDTIKNKKFFRLGIYVKIVGRGYCRWSSGSGHHCKSHFGEEFYLNEKTFFVGDDDDGMCKISNGRI